MTAEASQPICIPKEHRSALEVVLTVLHAGGKFDKGSYKVSGGLHGVGVSCVNALSKEFHVEVCRNGKHFVQDYAFGKPLYPVKEDGTSDKTGTKVTFCQTILSLLFLFTIMLRWLPVCASWLI